MSHQRTKHPACPKPSVTFAPAFRLLTSVVCLLAAMTLAPRAIAASVTKVAAGTQHSLFLADDGTLWAMGLNNGGQLGDGTTATRYTPVQAGTGVIAVAAGGQHSLFVKNDSTLWAMGGNYYGQLGDGSTTDQSTSVQVADSVIAVAAGGSAYRGYSLFVKNDGSLWAVGENYYGQLGNGSTTNQGTPVQVADNVIAVAAGSSHSLFVKSDGSLWAMGYNYYGQLGDGTTTDQSTPVQVADNVIAAAAGSGYSLFVKSDSTLWAMGHNYYGQLGDGTTMSSRRTPMLVTGGVIAVAAGDSHSVFVKSDDTLWAMGSNLTGQLGDGSATDRSKPVFVFGKGPPSPPAIITQPASQSVYSGEDATFAITVAGYPMPALQWQYSSTYGLAWANLSDNERYSGAATNVLTVKTGAGLGGLTGMQYRCVATNASGTATSDAAVLSFVIDGQPAITTQPASQTVLAGQNATFTMVASGDPTLFYQWQSHDYGFWSSLRSGTSASLTLTNVTAAMNGAQYRCVVSNSLGFAYSNAVTLTVNYPPAIASQPASQAVLAGENAMFTIAASGNPAPACQWQSSTDGGGTWANINSATSANLTVSNATADMNGAQYRCVVTNAHGAAASNAATLSVTALAAPAITAHPAGRTATAGSNAIFTITATGAPAPSYQWQSAPSVGGSWADIPGATSTTLIIDSVTTAFNGTQYRCVATNSLGTAQSNAATLTVNPDASSDGRVVKAVGGANHSLFLTDDGTLWAMGTNIYGQLGDGSTTERNAPVQIATGVSDIAAGWDHSLFVKHDGTLWAVGRNYYGQLGNGTTVDQHTPVQIATEVRAVVAGYGHSLFVKSNGTLWDMGWNAYGQLGDASNTERHTPVQVAADVIAATAGYMHSMFLKSDGTLWAMGYNVYGQLGDGSTMHRNAPVQVASHVFAMAAGSDHSLFVKNDGSLWGMGYNESGQLGDGPFTYRITPAQIATGVFAAAAGYHHSLFVKSDGSLWSMGRNLEGQLGDGSATNRSTPAQVDIDVTAVAAGWGFSLYVKNDGTLWAMGANRSGGLGDGSTTNQHTPVQVAGGAPASPAIVTQPASQTVIAGATATFAITATGNLAPTCQWQSAPPGGNSWTDIPGAIYATLSIASVTIEMNGTQYRCVASNSLGTAQSNAATLTVNPAGTGGSSVVKTAAGYRHSLYLTDDGTLWAMGWNPFGQLGDGTTEIFQNTPVQVATGVTSMSAGYAHSLFLKSDGTLWATGRNLEGQFGDGTTTGRNTPVQVAADVIAVAAGHYHSLYVKNDGTLWAMGGNSSGGLGDGSTTDRHTPVQVADDVIAVAAGWGFSLYVKNDGTLWVMGWNDHGQLGDGTTTDRITPVQVATGVAAAAAGLYHSLFVKNDGTLWCMGLNSSGQLGDDSNTDRITPVQVAAGVATVAVGNSHSLFIKNDGTLWGMGFNGEGQLGDATTTSQKKPAQIAAGVIAVAAGHSHSLYAKSDGTLWAMGNNDSGQLGDGTHTNRNTPAYIAGGHPVFLLHPASQSITAGSTARFTVAAKGTPEPTLQWQSSPDGATWTNLSNTSPYAGVTTAALTIADATTALNGTQYRCVATNTLGATHGNAATLTVTAAPDPALAAAQQLKTQLETPGSAIITIPAATINLSLVNGATLAPGKTILGADTASTIAGNLTLPPDANDTVILGLCFTTGTLAINGPLDTTVTHCTFTDTPVIITGGADNVTFSWNEFIATAADPGSAMRIDNAGAATGILLQYNLWANGLKTDMPAVSDARVAMFNNYFATPGNTTATIAGPGAQILSACNIYNAVNNPVITQSTGLLRSLDNFMAIPTGTIAPGDDTVFVPAYSHIILPAGNNYSDVSALVTLIANHAGNTAARGSITPPSTPNATSNITATVTGSGANTTPAGATVPPGGSVTLTANTTGFTPTARQWYRDNFVIVGATGPAHTITTANAAAHTGAYSVAQTTPANEIVFSGAFTVRIGTLAPPLITMHPASQTIDTGDTAIFTVAATGDNLAYQWWKDNAPISAATGSNHTIPDARQTHAGAYTVRVSNGAGFVTSNTATLTVNPGSGGNGGSQTGNTGGGGGAPSLLWLGAVAALAVARRIRIGWRS